MDAENWIARPGPNDRPVADADFPFTRYVHRDGRVEALEFVDGTVVYAIPGRRKTFLTEDEARATLKE